MTRLTMGTTEPLCQAAYLGVEIQVGAGLPQREASTKLPECPSPHRSPGMAPCPQAWSQRASRIAQASEMAGFDIVIRGARVVHGSGAPGLIQDVALPADGIDHLLLNGVPALSDGVHHPDFARQVLRRSS